jgi:NhaP-type Na+/H+ or K+/H+ antiporter
VASFPNPALTVGTALAVGVIAQVAARHIQMPSIVLLLVVGVLLGPDMAGVVQPGQLGQAIHVLVGFAVAIILFEGAMNLDLRRLRAEGLAIRRLVTIGAFITGVGATLAARFIMAWDWRLSAVFGTLVIVTGPTVVTPLLRRLRVKDPVNTVLQAEGVLIDPIGAIIAVVTLEVAYAEGASMIDALRTAAVTLGTGALIGLLAGMGISLVLRGRQLVPTGFQNILVLSLVVAVFQLSDVIQSESGLAAVTVAGVAVGNARTRAIRELIDFKEQLTVLMIGLLFVLLAADVRLADVRDLGWRAGATVAALMLLVRPLQAYLCTQGTTLSWRERLFIAQLAPRGIVAAAIASLFAQQLADRGQGGGEELRALVFLVIAVTVTIHGLTGAAVAQLLGLRRPSGQGYVILGANALGRALGWLLRKDGQQVAFIDSNPDQAWAAERAGFTVAHGQGLQSSVLAGVDVDARLACIGLTPNEEINLLFVRKVREETRNPNLYVALRKGTGSVQADHVHEAHASVLFGASRPLDGWLQRIENDEVRFERWRRTKVPAVPISSAASLEAAEDDVLIFAIERRGRLRPYADDAQIGAKEEIVVAIWTERLAEVEEQLELEGWSRVMIERDASGAYQRVGMRPSRA